MSITPDKIEAIAPDQASLASAVKIKRSAWQSLAHDDDFIWGECQGSGSTPYRACAQISDAGAKCSCPSRKFPCKHALSLMLVYSRSQAEFAQGQPPAWVGEWSSRRRPGVGAPAARTKTEGETELKPAPSLDAALAEPQEKERDEKTIARAAEQRERVRAQREAAILQGLDELELWIADHLNQGLAKFPSEASASCARMTLRLVDAKAPGLANWLDALPSRLLTLPEPMRGPALIGELGGLRLLACAYRRQEKLPLGLREDVRRLVGWPQERQALLEDAKAERLVASWTVIGALVHTQPDKLRRWETWLTANVGGRARHALLLDFAPVSQSVGGPGYAPGEILPGELVFHPSATPLRAILARRLDAAPPPEAPPPGSGLASALDEIDELRALCPWLGGRPMLLAGPRCVERADGGLWIADGSAAVPVAPTRRDEARALAGTRIDWLAGVWDGHFLTPTYAQTTLGRWASA